MVLYNCDTVLFVSCILHFICFYNRATISCFQFKFDLQIYYLYSCRKTEEYVRNNIGIPHRKNTTKLAALPQSDSCPEDYLLDFSLQVHVAAEWRLGMQ